MIYLALKRHLLADAAIAAKLGGTGNSARLRPDRLLKNDDGPSIVVEIPSDEEFECLDDDETAGGGIAEVQLVCRDRERGLADALARMVTSRLRTIAEPGIQSLSIKNRVSEIEPLDDGDVSTVRVATVICEVHYE